jgi:hypothetical protein
MKKRIYEITDIDEFIKSLRSIILENFYEEEDKIKMESEFDFLMKSKRKKIEEKLTVQEAEAIIRPMLKTFVNNIGEVEYTISHKGFKKMLDELNKRVISNILMELAAEGLIETGFDDEKNDFIFWVSNEKNKE